ncbi:MAG TPA: serine/threonine-protein kinase, partial [Anaerolineae bacterium]|nr:serine/threonine-protein kinase [Anaerolineae bacterium]
CAIKEFRLGHLPTEAERRSSDHTRVWAPGREAGATREQAVEQFTREARLLAALDHPNLPKVTDYVAVNDGCFLVMPLVEGRDLAAVLEEAGGQPLPEAQVLAWIDQVLDVLAYCHAQGVIHRDVKPANMIVTPQGKVYLVDFGIAKPVGHVGTALGARATTPGYSPPEQYGQGRTDARSDIYAVGATLYALLTGQEPVGVFDRVTGRDMPSPRSLAPAVSAHVAAAVMRALAILPDERFQSVEELRAALAGQELQPNESVAPADAGMAGQALQPVEGIAPADAGGAQQELQPIESVAPADDGMAGRELQPVESATPADAGGARSALPPIESATPAGASGAAERGPWGHLTGALRARCRPLNFRAGSIMLKAPEGAGRPCAIAAAERDLVFVAWSIGAVQAYQVRDGRLRFTKWLGEAGPHAEVLDMEWYQQREKSGCYVLARCGAQCRVYTVSSDGAIGPALTALLDGCCVAAEHGRPWVLAQGRVCQQADAGTGKKDAVTEKASRPAGQEGSAEEGRLEGDNTPNRAQAKAEGGTDAGAGGGTTTRIVSVLCCADGEWRQAIDNCAAPYDLMVAGRHLYVVGTCHTPTSPSAQGPQDPGSQAGAAADQGQGQVRREQEAKQPSNQTGATAPALGGHQYGIWVCAPDGRSAAPPIHVRHLFTWHGHGAYTACDPRDEQLYVYTSDDGRPQVLFLNPQTGEVELRLHPPRWSGPVPIAA